MTLQKLTAPLTAMSLSYEYLKTAVSMLASSEIAFSAIDSNSSTSALIIIVEGLFSAKFQTTMQAWYGRFC